MSSDNIKLNEPNGDKKQKTQPNILKAVKKYNQKPEIQLKIKQYYINNKEIMKNRSRLRYIKTKDILNKYKNGLLINNENLITNDTLLTNDIPKI